MKVEFYHPLAAWIILKLCERKFQDHSMTIVNWELRTRFSTNYLDQKNTQSQKF